MIDKLAFGDQTIAVAKNLLGTILVHQTQHGPVSGWIVETEAYLGTQDPAAHSFIGQRPRTQALFGPPGTAYIYQIYGLHYCFNVVTGEGGRGEAVLIRAIEPNEGIAVMMRHRRIAQSINLTNGPARLVQALGISIAQNGHDLSRPPLQILPSLPIDPTHIVTTTRVGITKAADLPLRFYLRDNPYISRK